MEEDLYEAIVSELQRGYKRDGFWAKAIANGNGNEDKAKSLYIKYRIQSIIDENNITEILAKEENSRKESKVKSDNMAKEAEQKAKVVAEKKRIEQLKKNLRRTGGKYIEDK